MALDLNEVMSGIPGAVYQLALHPDGRRSLRYVSNGIKALSGVEPEAIIADPEGFFRMVVPEDRPRLERAIAASAAACEPWDCEYRIATPMGERKWVHSRSWPHRVTDGSVICNGMLSDITRLKATANAERRSARPETAGAADRPATQTEDEAWGNESGAKETRENRARSMLEAQKLGSLSLLAGVIAHDFNNMIGSILGNVSFALRELPPGAQGRDAILDIETAARRAAELTRQLLAYAGKGRFGVESLNLNPLVQEIAAVITRAVPDSTVLRFDFAKNLPSIDADPVQIRQVLMNIVINACQSLVEKTGVVTITTGQMEVDEAYVATTEFNFNQKLDAGSYVYLAVSDTGRGMAKETLRAVLEPLFTAGRASPPSLAESVGRGAPPASRAIKSGGLGLAAVVCIIRGHRGAFGVHSEPGNGTTFKVLLPFGKRARGVGRPADASRR